VHATAGRARCPPAGGAPGAVRRHVRLPDLLGAVSRSPDSSNDAVSVLAGTLRVPAFFGSDNVARIMREAGQAAPS
jgi:hypothetical protein